MSYFKNDWVVTSTISIERFYILLISFFSMFFVIPRFYEKIGNEAYSSYLFFFMQFSLISISILNLYKPKNIYYRYLLVIYLGITLFILNQGLDYYISMNSAFYFLVGTCLLERGDKVQETKTLKMILALGLLPYFLSGLWKLRRLLEIGLIKGQEMSPPIVDTYYWGLLQNNNFEVSKQWLISMPAWLDWTFYAFVMIFELGVIFCILKRTYMLIASILILAFHLGTKFLYQIFFMEQMLIVASFLIIVCCFSKNHDKNSKEEAAI